MALDCKNQSMRTDPPVPDDRKAELRSRLFSSEANNELIPIPPEPNKPKPENDAPLLTYLAIGFLAAGAGAVALAPNFPYTQRGLNPFEVLSCLCFSAAGVLGIWAAIRAFPRSTPDDDEEFE